MEKYNLGNKTAGELKGLLIESYDNIDSLLTKLEKIENQSYINKFKFICIYLSIVALLISPVIWGIVTLIKIFK